MRRKKPSCSPVVVGFQRLADDAGWFIQQKVFCNQFQNSRVDVWVYNVHLQMIDWGGGGGGANNRVTLTQQTEEIPIESESERERYLGGGAKLYSQHFCWWDGLKFAGVVYSYCSQIEGVFGGDCGGESGVSKGKYCWGVLLLLTSLRRKWAKVEKERNVWNELTFDACEKVFIKKWCQNIIIYLIFIFWSLQFCVFFPISYKIPITLLSSVSSFREFACKQFSVMQAIFNSEIGTLITLIFKLMQQQLFKV